MLNKLRKAIAEYVYPRKFLVDVVLIFPYQKEEKKILVVQEYIHYYQRHFWKFVSGGVDKENKDFLQHAQEELAEELGMESSQFYIFHSFEKIFGARGIHCFVAEDPQVMEYPPVNPDHDVITQTKWVSEQELWEMIDNKELIWNEGALTALQVFRSYKKKQP